MSKQEYHRDQMRRIRQQQHIEKLTNEGKCIFCEIILSRNPNHDCLKPLSFRSFYDY